MIEVKNLSYSINDEKILKDISLFFESKKIYGVIGPNGAGKSTLLKHIMRVIEPNKNTVFIDNKDIKKVKIKDYAKQVSFVFQENTRDVDFTVYEAILMGRYCYMDFLGNTSEEDESIVNNIIKELKIEKLRDRYISTLSGGEAQKVFIGRALAQNTPIILLDEPTSMLDIHNSVEIMNLVVEIKEKFDLTVIMVLHDLNLAYSYCDNIVLLKSGQVLIQGTRDEVIEDKRLKEVYNNKISILNYEKKKYIVPLTN